MSQQLFRYGVKDRFWWRGQRVLQVIRVNTLVDVIRVAKKHVLHVNTYRLTNFVSILSRAVVSGPAGPTLVGPLFGSKMRECLDDSYARAHALTVAAVFHSVDRGMDLSFTEITTQKFADIPERPLSL